MTRALSAVLLLATAAVAACQAVPTPSAQASASLPPATPIAVDWQQLELPDTVGPWWASGAISDADGFVVYGWINDKSAAWTSVDGATWTSVALPGFEGSPTRAAASRAATVLAGGGSTSRCAHPFGEFMWRRVAGNPEWAAVPFDEALFCAGGGSSIAATEGGFAVAGTGTGEQPYGWVSQDGVTWHDATAGLSFDAPPWMIGTSAGGFLVLGRGTLTGVWALGDGRSWTSVPSPRVAPAFNGEASGLTPAALIDTRLGTFALYESDDASLVSGWRREANGQWTELELIGLGPTDAVSGGVALDEVAVLFVVRDGVAGLLASTDFTTWAAVPVPDLNAIQGLARFGDRLVLVASINDANAEPHPVVFTGDVARLVP